MQASQPKPNTQAHIRRHLNASGLYCAVASVATNAVAATATVIVDDFCRKVSAILISFWSLFGALSTIPSYIVAAAVKILI